MFNYSNKSHDTKDLMAFALLGPVDVVACCATSSGITVPSRIAFWASLETCRCLLRACFQNLPLSQTFWQKVFLPLFGFLSLLGSFGLFLVSSLTFWFLVSLFGFFCQLLLSTVTCWFLLSLFVSSFRNSTINVTIGVQTKTVGIFRLCLQRGHIPRPPPLRNSLV